MKLFRTIAALAAIFFACPAPAQILMSAGTNYSQNFDTLAGSGTVNWTNNVTLPGWYAAKGPTNAVTYIAASGSGNAGSIYSFGVAGVNPLSDRALGSVAASSLSYAFGVRFTNDTGLVASSFVVTFTGEQWRNANTVTNTLAFSYQISSQLLTNADAANTQTWTTFASLNFNSPNTNGVSAIDGNNATNRQAFSGVVLAGAAVLPGQEIFLRWRDVDDGGSDAGLAVDDLTVTFSLLGQPVASPPFITTQPGSVSATAGDAVSFSVVATGTAPLAYQWRSNNIALPGATNATLSLNNVTTNLSGSSYFVVITNVAGATNSTAATLTVTAPGPPPPAYSGTNTSITLMTYNVKGNGVTDWSTNTVQAQAIGRQLLYLKPDIITFNEIPRTNVWQMANWVTAFMPGFYLATNSGNDGFINCVIASRYPINRSKSWLDGANLNPFGYTNTSSASADNYTRDLFEAEINVPNWPLPLHVFTTHLKSSASGYTDAAAKRAAEAAAITNFLATNFFVLYPTHPFTLSGDMNEADTNTLALQRLTSAATTLQLMNPTNPVTGSINTYSSDGPSSRIDYIFPCALLAAGASAGQVFRTDVLTPTPTNLMKFDSTNASDHLPVLMTFANPFNTPFKILSCARTNLGITLKWESATNRVFNVQSSTNLTQWTTLANGLFATGSNFTFTTNNLSDKTRFFRVQRVP